MRTIENLPRFLKALEHVDEHYYSKPYGITPILDRWFNQLAMVQFEKSKEPLHITAQIALEFVDIILDGKVIPKKDIEAIINLYGQKSDIKKEFENIIDDIDKNILRLEEETKTTTADDEKALAKHKKELTNYKAQRSYHEKLFNLYSGISENGKSILNESALEREYRDKIKNIVYKPNHGLTHAARAARAVTEIEAFLEKHNKSEKKFKGDMEKLQYMMLFSVVGRKDETGFNDKSTTARKTYKSFRAASARAYLNYYEKDETTLYKDRNELYRDALLVELMGYNSLEQVFNNL